MKVIDAFTTPTFFIILFLIYLSLTLGFSVLQVMATDRDQGDNGEFIYQLSDPEGAFSIDPRSGWLTVRNQVR